MNRKMRLVNAFLIILSMFLVIPTNTGVYMESRTTLDYQGFPVNFQDFPDAFTSDNSIVAWDDDMIDVEKVSFTGDSVYVAVLDTGLKRNWRDYFPEENIVTEWGRSFIDEGIMKGVKTGNFVSHVVESRDFTGEHPHGTFVISNIIGFSMNGTYIAGIAPNAKIIPVKVLEVYNGLHDVYATDEAIAAGIYYVADLAKSHPDSRFVISMSIGDPVPISEVQKNAIDYAISQNVIVVAAAGNEGVNGMLSPASYAPVISVGLSGWASYTEKYGWTGEWVQEIDGDIYFDSSFWVRDVPEDNAYLTYISDFSSRERSDLWPQELDIIAPGSFVLGPFPFAPGQSHLPWWSNGKGNGVAEQYWFLSGTSLACPHVSAVAALMLQANPSLTQAEVESLLRSSADPLPFSGSQKVLQIDPNTGSIDPNTGSINYVTWGFDGYNAVGYGLLQADSAVEAALTYKK